MAFCQELRGKKTEACGTYVTVFDVITTEYPLTDSEVLSASLNRKPSWLNYNQDDHIVVSSNGVFGLGCTGGLCERAAVGEELF